MKKVLLLLAKGFETYEASVFIDVIGWNYQDGDRSTQLFTCGINKEVVTTFNQKFIVDFLLDEITTEDFDALAIPGGFEEYGFYDEAYSVKFQNIIKHFYKENKPIASICVAALTLGKSGIIEGKKATTYNSTVRRRALKEFGAEVIDQPVVLDGNIITSCNPASAIDVALLLLEILTTEENAQHIRKIMGFK